MYVLDSAERDLIDGSTKKHLFCHRSWNYRKKGKDLRVIKSLGTNKINITYYDFNITYSTKRHKDDAVSVSLWVDEMGNLGSS
ncbi:unnamed protein product [Macrosiphum euphorbiae]|uniref:Uncharacterized protein n=1 Tax=Macrosiphum euphorbiae TaxID=13131 RepID=A0AAV0YAJ7_9HEMI|nr:unnamed protein product [Macrosiphum euphorbiae]